MKKLAFLIIASMMMGIVSSPEVFAQPKHAKKQRKEHRKQVEKRDKAFRKQDKHFRKEAEKRDKAYRKQAKHVRKEAEKRNKHYRKMVGGKGGPPPWAPAHGYRARQHVYFRDYYTFYDPYREGYVYWHENDWIFSRNVPSFMANVDLGRARIELMADIPLSNRPERYFDRYANRYPRDGGVQLNLQLYAPLSVR